MMGRSRHHASVAVDPAAAPALHLNDLSEGVRARHEVGLLDLLGDALHLALEPVE